MPQQTTLLSFFSRTPKSSPSTSGSGSNGISSTPTSTVRAKSIKQEGQGESESPVSKAKSSSTPGLSTPVSRTGTGTKRRRTSGSGSASQSNNSEPRKKIRGDDSPSKDYTEGGLVWAKLEGYPWWPAMIRGEDRGSVWSRKGALEFHVQFFDEPPSRAWIRKGDLKLYGGNQDADILPAKSDSAWMAACKFADKAVPLSPGKRLEKYWFEFDSGGAEENDNQCDNNSAAEEMEVEVETPKSRNRESKKHRRILKISSSSEDEEQDEEDKKESKNKNSSSKPKAGKSKRIAGKQVKREDDEYSPNKNGSVDEESESSESPAESDEASDEVESNESDEETGSRRKSSKTPSLSRGSKKNDSVKTNGGTIDRNSVKSRLQRFTSSDSPCPSPKPSASGSNAVDKDDTMWTHLTATCAFAHDDKRMDANRHKKDHPDFDPRTLYVPQDFMSKLTPAMRQWWEMKSKNFDTVLFFKVGKFYEFYHWDACIAAKELGITYMKGEYAHSGFPEISYSRFANALVQKGYKVARIEQTETPEMLAERIKTTRPQKHEKVITREICQISTQGVRYASFQDEANSSPFASESCYLLGVTEKISTSVADDIVFGVCFIDTTIGTFHVGQFTDDRHCSRLRTLVSHYTPAQILYEKGKISANLQQLFQNLSSVRKDSLIPDKEFWSAKKTLKYLAEQDYFRSAEGLEWPPGLQTALSKSDGLGLTPDENWELGIKCLGGVVWYLKHCLLDHDLLSQKRFEIYEPVDVNSDASKIPDLPQRCKGPKYMILDGITLRNLEILEGPLSLFSVLDKCGTNFGKRLLRHWLCLPLAIPEEISERQDAIDELLVMRECREKVTPLLKSLPDLERILSKIHYLGSAHRSEDHPDGRAFFFEEIKYSKNKISELLATLRGFKTCVKIIQEFKRTDDEDGIKSTLLSQIVAKFPSLDKLLTTFDNAFDHQTAFKEGKIKPKPGADEEYDNAKKAVQDIEDEAQEYLRDVAKQLKTRAVYFGSDKKRFQIEVPESVKVPKTFEMSSSRKGFKRYYSVEAKEFLSSILKAEANREEILRDITRRIFAQFDKHREIWSQAVECIAHIDVLISLSLFSESQEVMCRPVVSYAEEPFLNIVDGRHPCVSSDTYIPNNTTMGVNSEAETSQGSFIILTGPNMGGKSTLMRQVGLIAVLSHLGCYVPAEKCELSVVDRIFTRLGANDNIGEGESTFFVEMSETSAILKHGRPDSLLLIDELGRGTATYDGTAIAYAVAKELAERKCRSLFSTHYHTLVESLRDIPSIQMTHMACMVENENEDDPTQESITFLYKMISGPCPKSYGFNAARLAGISDDVIRIAHKKAKELEALVAGVRSFTNVYSSIRQKTFSLNDFAALKI